MLVAILKQSVIIIGLILLGMAASCAAPAAPTNQIVAPVSAQVTPPSAPPLAAAPPAIPKEEKPAIPIVSPEKTPISWKEAGNYIGQNKTVEGSIVGCYYATSVKGKPTFLNFNNPYKGYFTCIIWDSDRAKFSQQFPPNPETYLLHKLVRVTGLIEEYPRGSGIPEIVLKNPSQIEIVPK